MHERNSGAVEAATPIRERIANLVDHAKNAGAVLLAGLNIAALAPVAVAEGFSMAGPAEAASPPGAELDVHAVATASRSRQAEEFARVTAETAAGAPLSKVPPGSLILTELCKDGHRKVPRTVTVRRTEQPLGNCNLGNGGVTVTAKTAPGWKLVRSAPKQHLSRVTRANNHHFVFTEQQESGPATTLSPGTTTIPQPSSNSGSAGSGGSGAGSGGTGGGGTGGGTSKEIGADISWVQCTGSDNTGNTVEGSLTNFSFGIVDLEGGLGYSTNPCLSSEVADFTLDDQPVSFYVNTGWYSESSHINPNSPKSCTAGDEVCLAYNYGYNNALYAVQSAASEGVSVTGIEVDEDLETDNTWSADPVQNQASLQGTADGLLASGASSVLLYTNIDAENVVLGGEQNGQSTWFAPGVSTADEALTYCTSSVTGGPVKRVQFNTETSTGTPGIPIDGDVNC